MLDAEASAALRDQLAAELKGIGEPIEDFGRVEAVQDFAVQLETSLLPRGRLLILCLSGPPLSQRIPDNVNADARAHKASFLEGNTNTN
jgi:hypothetical protein